MYSKYVLKYIYLKKNRILLIEYLRLYITQTASRKSIDSLSDARRPYLSDGRDYDYTASIIIL